VEKLRQRNGFRVFSVTLLFRSSQNAEGSLKSSFHRSSEALEEEEEEEEEGKQEEEEAISELEFGRLKKERKGNG
jgi:hypothetical protein